MIVLNSTGKGLSILLLTEEKSISNGFRGCRVCYTPQVVYKISGAAGKEHSPETEQINATTPDAGLRGTDAAGFMTLPTGQESASLDFPKKTQMDGREPMLGLHDPSCLSLTSQRDCICRVLHFVVSM